MSSPATSSPGLPWQQGSGQPCRVGVCLSGGGIRAAAFALGALQGLQQERRLLCGPDRADYLAAVSGGSYVAASATLTSAALHAGEAPCLGKPPVACGSPEADHIIRSGGYLQDYLPWRLVNKAIGWLVLIILFVLFTVVNLAGFVSLAAWAGAITVGVGAIGGDSLTLSPDWLAVTTGGAGVALGGALLLRGRYAVPRRTRYGYFIGGLAIFIATAPSLVARTDDLERALDWLGDLVTEHSAVALLGMAVYFSLAAVPIPWRPARFVAAHVIDLVPRLVAVVILVTSITLVSTQDQAKGGIAVGVGFGGAALFAFLLARVSLHRLNRARVATCFAVVRSDDGIEHVSTSKPLHSLAPPSDRSRFDFPRLLVCATANVVFKDSTDKRRQYAPLVFSHDVSGVDVVPASEANYCTERIELGQRPGGLTQCSEPVLSLMTAVAASGAAVTPSMGSKTRAGLRSVLALLNLRMGTWMPNPLNKTIRDEVATTRDWWGRNRWYLPSKHWGIGGGYDEFVPELFGAHRRDAARVYVSDGGHYDNLGLLTLLRGRCKEIWCVDAEADPRGKASQLINTIKLAVRENLVKSIDLKPEDFRGDDGVLGARHAIGTIHYDDKHTAELVVIKLGLTAKSSQELKRYSKRDRWWMFCAKRLLARLPMLWALFSRFPFDHTFVHMAFSKKRMEAYVDLGRENAVCAAADPGAPGAPG